MKGSRLAYTIIQDQKREEYFKRKYSKECIIDNNKKCKECNYKHICSNNSERSDDFEVL